MPVLAIAPARAARTSLTTLDVQAAFLDGRAGSSEVSVSMLRFDGKTEQITARPVPQRTTTPTPGNGTFGCVWMKVGSTRRFGCAALATAKFTVDAAMLSAKATFSVGVPGTTLVFTANVTWAGDPVLLATPSGGFDRTGLPPKWVYLGGTVVAERAAKVTGTITSNTGAGGSLASTTVARIEHEIDVYSNTYSDV